MAGILTVLLAFFVSACTAILRPAAGQQPLAVLLTDFGEKEFKAQFVRTHSDVDAGLPLFLNNRGFVEAAVNMGSLASITGAAQGMRVIVERWSEADPLK